MLPDASWWRDQIINFVIRNSRSCRYVDRNLGLVVIKLFLHTMKFSGAWWQEHVHALLQTVGV